VTDSAGVQRVRIYLSQADHWEDRPRYLALLAALQRAGASGASALSGLAGFGPEARVRPVPGAADSRRPVVVEWIDRAERIEQLLPLVDDLIGNALVTREPIGVYRASLRARGPFAADLTVGDLMHAPAAMLQPSDSLGAALEALLAGNLSLLPIRDAAGRFVGMLTEQDLAWRAELRLPLRLIPLLTSAERDALMAPLIGRTIAEILGDEVRSVSPVTTVPQALIAMVEWGYAQVPVVDEARMLVGLLGQDDVLRAVVAQLPEPDAAIRDVEPLPQAHLIMQTSFVQVGHDLALNQVLERLLQSKRQRLFVTDEQQRLVGVVDGATVFSGLTEAERAVLLAAWQQVHPPVAAALPGVDRDARAVIVQEQHTIAPETTIGVAAQRLIDTAADHLAVVDTDGKLLGIIARGALIRALLQQST
jgi:CBS-domain-containing membrane protein